MKNLTLILVVLLLTQGTLAYAQSDGSQTDPGYIAPSTGGDNTQTDPGYLPQATGGPSAGVSGRSQTSNTDSGFVALAPIPGLTDIQPTQEGLAGFFNNLYKYLIGFAAMLAIIMIIWGGIEYSWQDIPGAKSNGKERILQAILGLILVLSPVLVFSIINPSILNLSINLTKLDTASGFPTGGNGVGAGSPTSGALDPATQCSVKGTAGILRFATCPSGTAAQTWGQQNCPTSGILQIITTPPNLQNNAGTITTVTCTERNVFDFIRVGPGLVPNQLKPLVVTSNSKLLQGSNTTYQTNGSDAMQYTNICQSVGLQTCVSDAPALSWSHSCLPAPSTTAPPAAPKPIECYIQTLSCRGPSVLSSVNRDLLYCVSSPTWTPFQ